MIHKISQTGVTSEDPQSSEHRGYKVVVDGQEEFVDKI